MIFFLDITSYKSYKVKRNYLHVSINNPLQFFIDVHDPPLVLQIKFNGQKIQICF